MIAIDRMCQCDPAATEQRVSGGSVVIECRLCGASAISLSAGMPAFVRDTTRYEVSVALSTSLLKTFVGLIKQKTGLTTPELMAKARDQSTVVLVRDRAAVVHYALRELAAAGLAVRVDPPYPHDIASDV